MHVLIVKISSMGDILHTLPALTDAMQAIPNIHFDWVVEEDFAEIPIWHPSVDKVIPIAIRRWRKHWFSDQHRAERTNFKYKLRSTKYDIIIDAQGLIKSALLVTRLAKGKKHGQDIKSAREAFASWYYDVHHTISKHQHAVERTRELFAKSIGYKKPKNQGDYLITNTFSSVLPNDAYQYLIFLHTTTNHKKHWPESYWRELIRKLKLSLLRIKLPWGTKKEYQQARRLADGFDYVDILPHLTLKQIAQQIAGTRAVVSVDTGLNHLTAALNRPNISLYGPTDPKIIGGYGKNQITLRSPTHNLIDLTVDNVLSQLRLMIS